MISSTCMSLSRAMSLSCCSMMPSASMSPPGGANPVTEESTERLSCLRFLKASVYSLTA